MGKFAVVEVDADHCDGYVAGVECLAVYDLEAVAQAHIDSIREKTDAAWVRRCSYIQGFVDGIDVPDLPYVEWMAWVKQHMPYNSYMTRDSFRKDFRRYLEKGHPPAEPLDGYDPPPEPIRHGDLFVMEIKEAA